MIDRVARRYRTRPSTYLNLPASSSLALDVDAAICERMARIEEDEEEQVQGESAWHLLMLALLKRLNG